MEVQGRSCSARFCWRCSNLLRWMYSSALSVLGCALGCLGALKIAQSKNVCPSLQCLPILSLKPAMHLKKELGRRAANQQTSSLQALWGACYHCTGHISTRKGRERSWLTLQPERTLGRCRASLEAPSCTAENTLQTCSGTAHLGRVPGSLANKKREQRSSSKT